MTRIFAPGGTASCPAECSAVACRNASPCPFSSSTKPNPLSSLNHFTVASTDGTLASVADAAACERIVDPALGTRAPARGLPCLERHRAVVVETMPARRPVVLTSIHGHQTLRPFRFQEKPPRSRRPSIPPQRGGISESARRQRTRPPADGWTEVSSPDLAVPVRAVNEIAQRKGETSMSTSPARQACSRAALRRQALARRSPEPELDASNRPPFVHFENSNRASARAIREYT